MALFIASFTSTLRALCNGHVKPEDLKGAFWCVGCGESHLLDPSAPAGRDPQDYDERLWYSQVRNPDLVMDGMEAWQHVRDAYLAAPEDRKDRSRRYDEVLRRMGPLSFRGGIFADARDEPDTAEELFERAIRLGWERPDPSTRRIVAARIIPSKGWTGALTGSELKAKVMVRFGHEEEEELLFAYYDDELSFDPAEFVGKTLEEGRALFHKKDVAYLQS